MFYIIFQGLFLMCPIFIEHSQSNIFLFSFFPSSAPSPPFPTPPSYSVCCHHSLKFCSFFFYINYNLVHNVLSLEAVALCFSGCYFVAFFPPRNCKVLSSVRRWEDEQEVCPVQLAYPNFIFLSSPFVHATMQTNDQDC